MNALPVLMYHHVSPRAGLVTVSPESFRKQMEALARIGWRTIGTEELEAFFAGGPLPKRSVMITFDDGYLDNLVHAHPVLQEFGLRAVLFVVTGWLGYGAPRQGAQECPDHRECKRRIASGESDSVMLRWSELEAIHQTGTFEVHSHTSSHTRWDLTLPAGPARNTALAEDLALSRETLHRQLGIASNHLCWPQGYNDPTYIDIAVATGFRYLYTTEKRSNLGTGDPHHIGRIVAKDRSASWLMRRMAIYSSPFLGPIYVKLLRR